MNMKRLLLALSMVMMMAVLGPAYAQTIPTQQGRVTDLSGKLTEAQKTALAKKAHEASLKDNIQVVVLVTDTLQGFTIEDYTYRTFNTWGVGNKIKNNGVLIVLAPNERKVRIETGRGKEASITDIQAKQIINKNIVPNLKKGQENWYKALDEAVSALIAIKE